MSGDHGSDYRMDPDTVSLDKIKMDTIGRTIASIFDPHSPPPEQFSHKPSAIKSRNISNAAAQGASEGSAVQGGVAAISGNAAESIVNTNQNVQLGNQIYDANGRRASAESVGAIGSGMQQFGSMITQNADKIRKLPRGLKGVLDPTEEV